MAIRYSEAKEFTKSQLEMLYLAAGLEAGREPARLKAGIAASSRVISAWDGKRLIGIIRAIDDGATVAFVCELIACPDCQGVKAELRKRLLAVYGESMRIEGLPIDPS